MPRLSQIAVIIFLALTGPALADAPTRIPDPGKFCDDMFANVSPFKSGELAKKVSVAMGKPENTEAMTNGLKLLDDRKIDYSKKALDRDFGNALRQIVYYMYVENIGFVYFRLNFKVTSAGWILASFNFKTETNELFPKDFIDH
jgi:hypothetical protein